MQRFDCLKENIPLLGWHLLEASAGTGKTFAIEHIFIRLLLEGKCHLEDILVVTFTRAATRQLKERIRLNLVKVEKMLVSSMEEPHFPYLAPFKGSVDALRVIRDALRGFDRAFVFTIHGFCFRMMQEFAFEAKCMMSKTNNPTHFEMTRRLKKEGISFLKKQIPLAILCPEQIGFLLEYGSIDDLAKEILRSKKTKGVSFSETHLRFQECIKSYKQNPIDPELLTQDFSSIRDQYKGFKEEFESQIETLGQAFLHDDSCYFRKLLREKGKVFHFLSPSNRKAKAKEILPKHYPYFFEWAVENLAPIIDEAVSLKNILANLSCEWKKWEEEVLFQEGIFGPDAILSWMGKTICDDLFRKKIGSRFQAVIIDEFQDTDPLQWDIFRKTFLSEDSSKTVYLVGDPKQSIYRFRSADVYTYFAAKDYLGEKNLYHLDTNFRSTKEMVGSLNALFSRKWLPLPRLGSSIEYLPVRAGLSIASDFQDSKGAVHWMVLEDFDEDLFFFYTASEIQNLKKNGPHSIAILVKDRYEMQKMADVLKQSEIPFVSKSHETLGQTTAFRCVRELFDAIFSPFDESASQIVRLGPFGTFFSSGALYWKRFLEKHGLQSFCLEFFHLSKLSCQRDFHQILEALLQWEGKEAFSFFGLKRFLDEFEKMDAEEGGKKQENGSEGAVEILTLHVSKGLEFDVVFALGLVSSSSSEAEAEENAEKLRQLYVAMTRAKLRLYVPLKVDKRKKRESPMHLFSEMIASHEGSFLPFLEKLSKKESLSIEVLTPENCLPLPSADSITKVEAAEESYRISYPVCYIQSFSSLTKQKTSFEKDLSMRAEPSGLPRGKEVGNVVHSLLEELFTCSFPIWKDFLLVDRFIEEKIRLTFLASWVQEIQQMVRDALSHPLFETFAFALKDLECREVSAEMEFLYLREPHFIKGFIDLVFCYEKKFYFLDWKTNVLENQSLNDAMKEHDYELQASLYAEAIRRCVGLNQPFKDVFGGAFYCFIRERKWHYLGYEVLCNG